MTRTGMNHGDGSLPKRSAPRASQPADSAEMQMAWAHLAPRLWVWRAKADGHSVTAFFLKLMIMLDGNESKARRLSSFRAL